MKRKHYRHRNCKTDCFWWFSNHTGSWRLQIFGNQASPQSPYMALTASYIPALSYRKGSWTRNGHKKDTAKVQKRSSNEITSCFYSCKVFSTIAQSWQKILEYELCSPISKAQNINVYATPNLPTCRQEFSCGCAHTQLLSFNTVHVIVCTHLWIQFIGVACTEQ